MPDIIITIDTAGNLTRAVDATCAKFGYQATLPGGGANPETKNQFAKRMVALTVKGWMVEYEARAAADAAGATAAASANSVVIT